MANLANLAATTCLVNLKSSASRKQPRKMEVSCQVNSLYCSGARQRKSWKTEQTIFSMIVLLTHKYESGRHDDRVLELKRLWITICRWLRCKKWSLEGFSTLVQRTPRDHWECQAVLGLSQGLMLRIVKCWGILRYS